MRVSSRMGPSLTPGQTTTCPWTSMPWSSKARSQRRLVAPAAVAQHAGPDLRVGGVDADPQRRQPFVDHPLQVGLGEAGQGGEVAVEERQAVVVVPGVQAAAQILWAAGG